MGERDAFGREKGEDSLADMGWKASGAPAGGQPAVTPEPPRVFDAGEAVRPFARPKAPEEPAPAAPVVSPEPSPPAPAQPPVPAAGETPPPPKPRIAAPMRLPGPTRPRRRGGGASVGRLIVFVAILGVLAIGASATVRIGGDAVHGLRDRIDALASPEPATPGKQASFLRAAPLRAALAKLPSGKVVFARIDTDSVDAQVISGGKRHLVHIQPGGQATDIGAPLGADQPGFKLTAAAPLRLVRTATRRAHKPAGDIDYIVGTDQGWVVFFKDGTRYRATPAGRHVTKL